jgi:ubiquinone/menaquinone biosynthesis C-methylase UbiE
MFTDPVKNLKMLHLREAEVVADLGAGTGFYTLAAGEMVPNGKVYAVEISKDFLEVVKNKVRDAHLKNVHIIWGNIEKLRGTQIGDCIVDAVIVSNVLFQIDDKNDFLEEIKRILKPGGRILLIDWLKEKGFHSKIKGDLAEAIMALKE